MSLTAAESLEIIELVTRADNCAIAHDAEVHGTSEVRESGWW